MISSVFGIAVVALPAGVITAGYLEALTETKKEESEKKLKTNRKTQPSITRR
jgi:voltage-gated potassium channel